MESDGQGVEEILDWVIKTLLSEEVTFELRHKR